METINNKNVNILEQVSLYNSEDLDEYLINLKNLFTEQNKLNNILKNKNISENISFITNFLEQNKNQIFII